MLEASRPAGSSYFRLRVQSNACRPGGECRRRHDALRGDRFGNGTPCEYTEATMNRQAIKSRDPLGAGLELCERSLAALENALRPDPVLTETVFGGTADWVNLLRYKLGPHLSGRGCLLAAVAGGTNTGKSTVFNLLQGREMSPVRPTAAATCRPLLSGSPERARQCLEGKLVPEFTPAPLDDPEALLTRETPADQLFVVSNPELPDRLVLLDTPDVDSIEKQHWALADHLRAAGDVIVAVVTGEKYRDERVVAFFREAQRSGRLIVPLINKADTAEAFATARRQLDEFCQEVGCSGPAFAVPHNFNLAQDYGAPIQSLDGAGDLMSYLLSLDAHAIKRRVFESSVRHLCERAESFLHNVERVAEMLASVREEYHSRAVHASQQYDPAPGAAVGGLFHEFVQARRGPFRRAIGEAGAALARSTAAVGRSISRAVFRRATLESPEESPSTAEIHATHRQTIEQITRNLAAEYIQSSKNLREPAAHLLQAGARQLSPEIVSDRVVQAVLQSDDLSEAFRNHAHRTLEAWWNDRKGRRHALEALDTILAVMPAAIAVPVSIYTAGVGVPEALVVAGPLAEQFVARVIEYQFGDALFDFLSPWRDEQQRHLAKALLDQVAAPLLAGLDAMLAALEGGAVRELRKGTELCLKALGPS